MILDHHDLDLILEIRDAAAHQVTFACISLKNAQIKWQNLGFLEPWWISMVAVVKSSILFKIHEDDQNPESASLLIYHSDLKKIIWESADYNFLRGTENGFLGYREVDGKNHFVLINNKNGKELSLDEETDITKYKNSFNSTSENKILSSPFHYLEASDYFEVVKNFLFQKHKIFPVKAIDYLEHQNAIIISYYIYQNSEKKESLLENFLLVLNRQGKILLQEKIDENLTGIGLETFFVIPDQLIFTSFKKEIKSYFIT
ncbi:hypothetical protein BH23BAC1_BH23BAC1_39300 [soil metagenome]